MSTQSLSLRRAIGVLAGCAIAASLSAPNAPAQQRIQLDDAVLRDLTPEVREALTSLATPSPEADGAATRRKQFRLVLGASKALPSLERVIDQRLDALEQGYARMLDEPIREAYRKHLTSLRPEQLREVAMTRRIWRNYILTTAEQLHFQKYFLMPATEIGKLLLPDVAAIRTKASKAQLQDMLEFNAYRDVVREALELGDDPTTGKLAPTGIPMPPLSKVRSYEEHLDHLHRTMAIASSVAPLGARSILLGNAAKARLIDYEEAEFVLYANEIRMLMGTISWQIDILACAATRDHSKDRVDGNASGHSSSLPGKRGFTHRLRRFGTGASSEGAGGGSNGRAYLHSLSYGGGHTGPLYSLKRNKVGVGRYGNCYTSTYAGDKNAIHPCQAINRELFMPPGTWLGDISEPSLISVYQELVVENYGIAQGLAQEVKTKTKMDKFLLAYFKIAIEVEADWELECISRIAAVGDLHGVELKIKRARLNFGSALDKRLKSYEKRMESKAGSQLLEAGRAYAAACSKKNRAAIEAITRDYADSVYAHAAKQYLAESEGGKKAHPLKWFLTEDKYLNRFEYLSSN